MISFLVINVLIFVLVPMLIVFNSVQKMRSKKSKVKPTPEKNRKALERLAISHEQFLKNHEFKFIGTLRYENVRLAVWEQNIYGEPIRFFILMQETILEFITLFNEETSLTSCDSASAFMYPHPSRVFIQSKNTKHIEQLWQYHSQGEHFLKEQFLIDISTVARISIDERLKQWLVKQGNYISNIPFYWFYAPYWFYIKRFKMLNVLVQEQLTKLHQ
jgi:hypothetical protein